jgi:hypothetical protein
MTVRGSRSRMRLALLGVASAVLLALLAPAAPASAESYAELCQNKGCAWWQLDSNAAPTNLPPGSKEALVVATAVNLGAVAVTASPAEPITVTDKLPPGLKPVAAFLHKGHVVGEKDKVKCPTPVPGAPVSCAFPEKEAGVVNPYESLQLEITVEVEAGAGALPNEVSVHGGKTLTGAEVPSPAPLVKALTVSSDPTSFGIETAKLLPENQDGSPATQAGEHPFQLTTTLDLNQLFQKSFKSEEKIRSAPALLKDLDVRLPPGLVGNPQAVNQCTEVQFSAQIGEGNQCPPDTAVGVALVNVNEPLLLELTTRTVPVFNLVPAPGEPARLGFNVAHATVVLDTSVRTGADYAVVVSVKNATQLAELLTSDVTIWGVPGDPRHDSARGWGCIEGGADQAIEPECKRPEGLRSEPFLTMPTLCEQPLHMTTLADSWLEPGRRVEKESEVPALGGCGALPFSPVLKEVLPEAQAANTPTGLDVVVEVPQKTTLEATGLAESTVRATTVALPPGMLLNPSAANGLEACFAKFDESPAAVGFTGVAEFEPGTPVNTFTAPLPDKVEPGVNFCPNGSKVGTVRIKSPDLAHELEGGTREYIAGTEQEDPNAEVKRGGVYLAQQNKNPFGSLFAMYLVAEDPVSHVLVKLAGEVSPNPVTGQISSTFNNTPPVPFETLKLKLFGGPRASVTTPPLCGTYTATSSFVPWSGTPAQGPTAAFNVASGAEGTGCAGPRPLAPGFNAGATSRQAGGFTGFAVNVARPDADQALTSLSMKLPTGVAAVLKSVTLCQEAQANQGTCGADSLIGHVTAVTGLGGDPFTAGVGQVFITGPYRGAPFGLSVVIPAQAGPFNFGNVVTRSTLSVDLYTAAVTIGSPIPTMVNTTTTSSGVPTQLKQLHVVVDRPNFQFNPTTCNPLKVEAGFTGDEGGSANTQWPLQVSNCSALPFKPVFTASSEAKTSKANGASLKVRVTSGGLGVANIVKTKVALPIALPSRLTTIQKACLAKVFEANPDSCPEGSNIGTAFIRTPVFANPLKGPAFLVSHGNEAFPDVEFVLRGEGLTIILDGKTDIKNGITTSSFESLPDAPFTEFETVLPAGPHSALAANGNLCTQRLIMPTTITSQSGTVIKQNTKIAVTGCPKRATLSRAQLLAKALKACRKKKNRAKRVACERAARKKYHAKKRSRHR